VRTDEMDALLTRIERLGNRVAASVLAATSIWAVVKLTGGRHRLPPAAAPEERNANANVGPSVRPATRTR
jgi:hypothetical protein